MSWVCHSSPQFGFFGFFGFPRHFVRLWQFQHILDFSEISTSSGEGLVSQNQRNCSVVGTQANNYAKRTPLFMKINGGPRIHGNRLHGRGPGVAQHFHLLVFFILLYCIILYCTVLYCTELHCIVLYCVAWGWLEAWLRSSLGIFSYSVFLSVVRDEDIS